MAWREFDDTKKEEHKIEDKFESPWAEPRALPDPKRRVVGWRNGGSINKTEQEKLLRTDGDVRRMYQDQRKAMERKVAAKQKSEEPLAGLPPTWQAFWSTVPELDAQAAFKMYVKKQQRQERAQQAQQQAAAQAEAASLPDLPEGVTPEEMDEEIRRLEEDVKKKLEAFQEKQRLEAEWDTKLARFHALERQEEEKFRQVMREQDKASYAHGVVQGKIRSSDQYFSFLESDTTATNQKKTATLKRANALMHGQIESMKGEVRQLLKVAAETLPPPPSADTSLLAPSHGAGSQKDGAISGTEDEGPSDINPPQFGRTTGLDAP